MILFDPELGSPEKTDRKSARVAAVSRLERVPSRRTLAVFLREARAAVRLRGEVSVLLTSDQEIRRLNRQFRGKNKATDVLSFPANGIVPDFAGDLAISVETALKQARGHGHSLSTEIKVLVLHGLLHLAGYDHEIDNGEMARRERVLRGRLRLPEGLIERASEASIPRPQMRGTGGTRKEVRR
jgi:probable rRNA maturation factor